MYLYICSCVLLLLLFLSIQDIIILVRHPFYLYLLYNHVPTTCTFFFPFVVDLSLHRIN